MCVAIKENKLKKKIFEGLDERSQKQELPSWLSFELAKKSGKILGKPKTEDFERVFDVN
jgi:hypothetical protein